MQLVLASKSPRRKELLSFLSQDFIIRTADTDETILPGTSPEDAVKQLAQRKGLAVERKEGELILSADTVVACDGKILGKPKDEEDAFAMLSMLSGRSHKVFTGYCLWDGTTQVVDCAETQVTFYPLSQEEIWEYIRTGEPMDKAGAYGIQGKGSLLVEGIQGDYFNVVGLPVAAILRQLRQHFGW